MSLSELKMKSPILADLPCCKQEISGLRFLARELEGVLRWDGCLGMNSPNPGLFILVRGARKHPKVEPRNGRLDGSRKEVTRFGDMMEHLRESTRNDWITMGVVDTSVTKKC